VAVNGNTSRIKFQLHGQKRASTRGINQNWRFYQSFGLSSLTGNSPLAYRNKATYPLGFSPTGNVQAGYYRRRSHHLINLNQCPIQESGFKSVSSRDKTGYSGARLVNLR
jgi:23S rRNA (uracil1939-C5)-methyltransferase